MDMTMDRVGNGYRLCVFVDLNGRIGDGVLLKFQERSMMEGEWWSSVLKGCCVWVTHTSNTRVCTSTQGCLIELLRGTTRLAVHAVPYPRGERNLIIGNVGERAASGKRIERRSLKPGVGGRTQRGRYCGREKGKAKG